MALDHGSSNSENARNIPSDSPRRKAPNTPKRARIPLGLLPWKSGKCITPSGSKFGTPSYPSPLDRIRTGRKDRAKQLGLGTPPNYADFESNQSFPGTTAIRRRNDSPEMDELKRCTLSTLKCDTLNSVSFAAGSAKGCFSESSPRHARTFGGSWVYYNFVGGGPTGVSFPTGIQSPNKAILTINAKTTEILMANKMACRLLGVNGSQLCGKLLRQFLNVGKKWYASEETQLGSSGESVLISGKVMELVTSEAETIPVSAWLHRLPSIEQEQRQVIVLEPVNRAVATIIFDKQGTILCGDEHLAALHGYQSTSDIKGLSVTDLMPHLKLPSAVAKGAKLPKDVKKQNTTGCTCDGVSFPVTVRIEMIEDTLHEETEGGGESVKPQLYGAVLWVFANISGLVTVFTDGSIHSCNNNFALMLFGYNQSQLSGKNITTLIPSFYDDIEFLDTESILLPPLGDDEEEEDEESKIYHKSSCYRNDSSQSYNTPRPMNPISKQIELMIEDVSHAVHSLALDSPSQFLRNSSASEPPTRSPSADCFLGNIPTMLPSGSCHAQLNATTSGEKSLAACFGLGAALPLTPRCVGNGISSPNRTSEKEGERERLRLPIRSEIGDFCSSKTTESKEKPATESDRATSPGSPVVEGFRSREGITSTPNEPSVFERPPKFVMNRYGSLESLQSIPEGSYFGLGMHKNGSDLEIIYQIKKVELDDGHVLYCLWISRDPEEMGEGGRPYCSLTFQSSLYNTSKLSFASLQSSEQSFRPHTTSHEESSIFEEEYGTGPYAAHYTTLQQIGKGGFGFVKMAYRNSDKLLVVTKFIRKSGIYDECWVFDSAFDKNVPLEISLLLTLKHPNIVQVLDVFENECSFQLVMEKHGFGMDLFEFIDRDPELDEPLASYIFRQMVSGISYLHKLNIIHRDIKDENVILDQRFCAKIIDFGSATFTGPDRLYSTFCGTMEYCSPEVLRGNKYRGPELEVWSLGITLYVLMYGEDPFYTLEERLAARLKPPFAVSQSLLHLLSRMLDPDPVTRCTLDEAAEHNWTNQPVTPEKYCFEDVVHATVEEMNPSKYYNPEMPIQQMEIVTTSPVKSDRSEGKERRSPSLSNTSDECYEEQDSFS